MKLLDEADELRKLRAEAGRRTADLVPSLFHEMFGEPATNPKAWPVSTFADHLELLEYGPRFYNEVYSETGPRIVRITDLDGAGNLNFSTMPRLQVDSTTFDARGLKPGELVFARSGATVGKVAVVPDDAPACIAGAYFIRLRFESSIHPVYAAYLIRCPSVQGIIMNNSRQSAQQNFSVVLGFGHSRFRFHHSPCKKNSPPASQASAPCKPSKLPPAAAWTISSNPCSTARFRENYESEDVS